MSLTVEESTASLGNPMTADCPGREVFDHITGRWAMLILVALQGGPVRFHKLRDGIEGVSEKMLSQTLKTLARDGLVLRLVDPSVPPKVSYALTDLGQGLARQLSSLVQWIGDNIDSIVRAQQRGDQS